MDKITKASAEMEKLNRRTKELIDELISGFECEHGFQLDAPCPNEECEGKEKYLLHTYIRTLEKEHAAMKEALENARYQMDFGNESGDREEGKGNAKAYEIITKSLSSLTL